MYRDRSVSLNHIVRDIKRYVGDADRISGIFLRVPCADTNEFGKYMVRIDEFAITYTDCNGTFIYPIRYDTYCEYPEVDEVITVIEDENDLTAPFVCTTIGQKSIIQHIERYPSTDVVEPFWIRVKAEQDSFKPKDRAQPVLYHKLSVAENFV